MNIETQLVILYVSDLKRSVEFYDSVFALEKTVDVPVYIEYRINNGARLGLMPQGNTKHFLGDNLGSRVPSDGCPRAEVYFRLDTLDECLDRLAGIGATCVSPAAPRDWGDRVAYYIDPDNYVIAIAERLIE